jgi:hypothetical protein
VIQRNRLTLRYIAVNLSFCGCRRNWINKFPPAKAGQALLLKEGCRDEGATGWLIPPLSEVYNFAIGKMMNDCIDLRRSLENSPSNVVQ